MHLFCFVLSSAIEIRYGMLFSVDTDKNRVVFSVVVDYFLAIYFVHAVKKLE